MGNGNEGNLNIAITSTVEEARKQLKAVSSELKRVQKVLKDTNKEVSTTGTTSKTSMNKVENDTKKATSSMKEFKNSINEANKSLGSIVNFNKLYLLWNLTKRMRDTIMDIGESSGKYEKSIQRFETAFGKSEQLMKNANDFQSKLAGNFGLVEAELKDAQTSFYNILNSMDGVTETTLSQLSETLTKVVIDYSSMFGLGMAEATTKIKSAMVGETEAIRKEAGFDITEQTLGLKAQELGIERNTSQLSQMEKRLLRIIVLQDQMEKTGARGDFAQTVNSTNNQLIIMKAQLTEIGTWVGNYLFTIFGNVLYVINGVLMAIKEIIKTLAIIAGFKTQEKDIAGGLGVEDAENGVNSTTDAVKKLKSAVTGIDELNIISPDTGTDGAGVGDLGGVDPAILNALKEYDNLMGSIENKAIKIRDALLGWLGFEPTLDGGWKLGEGWTNFDNIIILIQLISALLGGKIIASILKGLGISGLTASRMGAGIGLIIVFGTSFLLTLKKIITDSTMNGEQLIKMIIGSIFAGLGAFLLTGSVGAGGLVLGIGLMISMGLAKVFGDEELLGKFEWLINILFAIGGIISAWSAKQLLAQIGEIALKSKFIWDNVKGGIGTARVGLSIVLAIAGIVTLIVGILKVIRGEQDGIGIALGGILLLAVGVGIAFGLIPALIMALIGTLALAFSFFASNWDLIVLGFWDFMTTMEVGFVTLVAEIVAKFKIGFTNISTNIKIIWNNVIGFIQKFIVSTVEFIEIGFTNAFYGVKIIALSVFAAIASVAETVVNAFLNGMRKVAGLVDDVAGTNFASSIENVNWGEDAWAKVAQVKSEKESEINSIKAQADAKRNSIDNNVDIKNEEAELNRLLKNQEYLLTYQSKVIQAVADKQETMSEKVADYQQKQLEKEQQETVKEDEKYQDNVLNEIDKIKGTLQQQIFNQNQNTEETQTEEIKNILKNSENDTSKINDTIETIENNEQNQINTLLSSLSTQQSMNNKTSAIINQLDEIKAKIGSGSSGSDSNSSSSSSNDPNPSTGMQVEKYATGGFPKVGSLFMAREAGAELVGNFGGRTGVVNNEQIIEGVSNGVYQAVVSAMARSKNKTVVQINGKEILTAVEKASRDRGQNVMGGAYTNA